MITSTPCKYHKYSLVIYLLLANGITWLCWIPGLVSNAQQGYIMPNFDTYAILFKTGFSNPQHMWFAVAFQLGVYGPLIGGLVAIWMDGGRKGIEDLWNRITRWNIGGRWYIAALAITFLLTGIPVGIFALTGGFALSTIPIVYVLFAFLVQLLTSGFGEEPGWRGFLLPRLQTRFDGEKYIWILGLIWAVWHYPIVIIQTLSMMQNVTVLQMLITILMGLVGQTMSLIGMTYIYVWLYHQTNSVFLVIVFHALSNLFNTWFPSFLSNPQAVGLLPALMPWVIVIFLQRGLGKDQFPGKPKPTMDGSHSDSITNVM
jgi:membrane protease YdiL (CAAX protease family)